MKLLPAVITNLFDTAQRRREQLRALEASEVDLAREYEAAIAAGKDDAAVDKIAGRMARTRMDIAAARMAIETAERQAKEQKVAAARAEKEQRLQASRDADAACLREGARFDELLTGEGVAQWRLFRDLYETARAKAIEAGLGSGHKPGHLSPHDVWSIVFARFESAVQEPDKEPLRLPSGLGSRSRSIASIASRIARENRAAAAPQDLEEEEA